MDIFKYKRISQECREDISAKTEKIGSLESELSQKNEEIKSHVRALQDLQTRLADLQDKGKEFDKLSKLAEHEQTIEVLTNDLCSTDQMYQDIKQKYDEMTKERENKEIGMNELKISLKNAKKNEESAFKRCEKIIQQLHNDRMSSAFKMNIEIERRMTLRYSLSPTSRSPSMEPLEYTTAKIPGQRLSHVSEGNNHEIKREIKHNWTILNMCIEKILKRHSCEDAKPKAMSVVTDASSIS